MSALSARKARQAAAASQQAGARSTSSGLGRSGEVDGARRSGDSNNGLHSRSRNGMSVKRAKIGSPGKAAQEHDVRLLSSEKQERTGHAISFNQEANDTTEASEYDASNGESASLVAPSQSTPTPQSAVCSSLPYLLKGKWKAQEGSIVCALGCGETLAFIGTASLTVLHGAISVAGVHLDSSVAGAHVFAPKSAALPVVCASHDPVELDTELAQSVGNPAARIGAIIRLEDLEDAHVEGLPSFCHLLRPDAFSANAAIPSSWPLKTAAPITEPVKSLNALLPPESWTASLQRVRQSDSPARYLVRGPKRTGKSTFSRLLLQQLQTSSSRPVCYLETDLGQPDFGPPGIVALHVFSSALKSASNSANLVIGPPWACLRQPARAHFIGDVSPRDAPRRYVAAIADLLHYFERVFQPLGASLVVNTQGWVKGMGADLLDEIERLTSPQHVFVMHGEQDLPVEVDPESASADGQRVIAIVAAPTLQTRERAHNAAEMRALMLTSYFYLASLPSPSASKSASSEYPQWDFSAALVAQRPFVVDVESGVQGGLHVLPIGAAVTPELQLMALNGSCVALVMSKDDSLEVQSSMDGGDQAKQDVWARALAKPLPDLSKSTCLGLAIVRAIDVKAGQVHLLTPITSEAITAARAAMQQISNDSSDTRLALVKGAIEVPVWVSLDEDLLRYGRAPLPASALNGAGSDLSREQAVPTMLAGVPLSSVPYLDFGLEEDAGFDAAVMDASATGANALSLSKRRIRRNLLRPSQQKP